MRQADTQSAITINGSQLYTYNLGYGLMNTNWDEYCMISIRPVSENTEANNEGTHLLHLLWVQYNQEHTSNVSLPSIETTCVPCKIGEIQCEKLVTTKEKFCQKHPDSTKSELYYDTQ
eukprot:1775040-Ditylum_brightwellii.AAC.1